MKINIPSSSVATTPARPSRSIDKSRDVDAATGSERIAEQKKLEISARQRVEPAKDQSQEADKLLKQVEAALERVREAIKPRQNSLEFQVDESPEKVIVVTVRDKETREVVRQIPSEEMLRISEALDEGLDPSKDGLFVEGRA